MFELIFCHFWIVIFEMVGMRCIIAENGKQLQIVQNYGHGGAGEYKRGSKTADFQFNPTTDFQLFFRSYLILWLRGPSQ